MTEEYIMRFAKSVCPEAPNLFLSTGERHIIQAATQLIENLRDKVKDLEQTIMKLSTR